MMAYCAKFRCCKAYFKRCFLAQISAVELDRDCECCEECDLVGNLVFRHEMRHRHRHISQYLQFVGRLFRATHPEENSVIIELLMYSRVIM